MKDLILKYGIALVLFTIAILAIYLYQQTLILQTEDLVKIKGTYENLALKTERQYPAKFHLKNDNNVYVLKRNAYKAWAKHLFLKNTKKGDELIIKINKKDLTLVNNESSNIIDIDAYLSLGNYNKYQKGGQSKLYLLCVFFLIVYIVSKNLKKQSYTLK